MRIRKRSRVILTIFVILIVSMAFSLKPASALEYTIDIENDWYNTGDTVKVTVVDAGLDDPESVYEDPLIEAPDGERLTFTVNEEHRPIKEVDKVHDFLKEYTFSSVDASTITLTEAPPEIAEFMAFTPIASGLSLETQPYKPTKLTVAVDVAPGGVEAVVVYITGITVEDNGLGLSIVMIVGSSTEETTGKTFVSVDVIAASKTEGAASSDIKISNGNWVYADFSYHDMDVAVITASINGDAISVELPETGPNTGVFEGTFTLVDDFTDDSLDELYSEHCNIITATYNGASDTAGVDDLGPEISELTPGLGSYVSDKRPKISAILTDGKSDVDEGNIVMKVDYLDVDETYVAGVVSYTPPEDLNEGLHDISIVVLDNMGNLASEAWSFTVDTEAPFEPTVADPGPINIVNVGAFHVTGTAEPGSTVTVELEDSEIGSVEETGSAHPDTGAFDIELIASGLVEGDVLVTAYATDAAGNIGLDSSAIGITKDVVAPPEPDVANLGVTMNPPDTDDTILGLAGAVEGKAIVTVYSDVGLTVPIGSLAAIEAGSFSAIPIGDNDWPQVWVTATDAVGNEGPATSMLNDIEGPPVPELISPESGFATTDTTPEFDWSDVTDSSGVTYDIEIDGLIEERITSDYQPTEPLDDGLYPWTVRAVDGVGNPSDWTTPWLLTVDTEAPTITPLKPETFTDEAMPLISAGLDDTLSRIDEDTVFMLFDRDILLIGDNGEAKWTTVADGAPPGFTGTYCVELGPRRANARVRYGESLATLFAIGEDNMAFNFYYPTVGKPPFVVLYLDTDVDGVEDVVLVGTMTSDPAPDTWTVGTAGIIVRPDEAWQPWGINYALADPFVTPFTVGNVEYTSLDYKQISEWLELPGFDTSTVTHIAYGKTGAYILYVDDIVVDGVTYALEPVVHVLDNGEVSYTPTEALAEGTHTVTVDVSDNAGNPTHADWSFTVDTIPPEVTIVGLPTLTRFDTQTITGTFEETFIDTIVVTSPVGSVPAIIDAEEGTYSAADVPLMEEENLITVTATDLAGNIGTATDEIVLDTITPETVIDDIPDFVKAGVLTAITGTGSDTDPGVVASVNVQIIKDGEYWNDVGWQSEACWVTATETTTWSYTELPGWEDGVSYTINAKAIDEAGNEDPIPATDSFTYDVTPPILMIVVDPATSSGLTTITVTSNELLVAAPIVLVTPPVGASVSVDVTSVIEPGIAWSYEFTVEIDCIHDIDVEGEDLAGNIGTDDATFEGDKTGPVVAWLNAEAYPLRIELSWSAGVDVKSAVAYYNIYRKMAEAEYTLIKTVDEPTTAYTDNGFDPEVDEGETFHYKVTAVDILGNEGEKKEASATFFEEMPPITFEIELWPSWNLISLPLIPEDPDIEGVLAGMMVEGEPVPAEEFVDIVWTYDSANGEWTYATYDSEEGWIGDLTTGTSGEPKMLDGKGYWIYMLNMATLSGKGYEMMPGGEVVPPAYPIYEGWNLIGFKTCDWSEDDDIDGEDELFTIDYLGSYFSENFGPSWYVGPWEDYVRSLVPLEGLTAYDAFSAKFWFLPIDIDEWMAPGEGYWIYLTEDGFITPPPPGW